MSELLGDKKELLKVLIKDLHKGVDPEEAKARFHTVLRETTPQDIAEIEEELINEGMSKEEIEKLCHVHLEVFKESLDRYKAIAPEGHPIHILMEEHKVLETYAGELVKAAKEIKKAGGYVAAEAAMKQYRHLVEHFKRSESHYVREENVLFPHLEKQGITKPPAFMWEQHNQIRDLEKVLYSLKEDMPFNEFSTQLGEIATSLADMLAGHFDRENQVLFPAALRVIDEEEWPGIRQEFDDLGYCCFTPDKARAVFAKGHVASEPKEAKEGEAGLPTGTLTIRDIEAILNNLPVDITFVDEQDTVRYFSESKERIFPRTKAIIGRKVQNCHPQDSVHAVEKVVDELKRGKRDSAEFWINLNERLIYIRYFAIRDKEGKYTGCLEVTQDITDIQNIQGEKRLL